MKQTRAVIENHLENNPEFQYHIDTHFVKIAENLESHPDIAIETCKSFIESISRTIIKNLEGDDYEGKIYERWNFPDLVRRMMNYLSDYTDFQDGFIDQMVFLMTKLGNHRNDTGDISHGRATPKEKISTVEDAILVMQMTDSIGQYLLGIYFSIDFEIIEIDGAYENEKFVEFNEFLDSQYPLPVETVRYSKALYEQDNNAYNAEFDKYITPQ